MMLPLWLVLPLLTQVETRPPNGAGQKPAFPGQTRIAEQKLNVAFDLVPITNALKQPWGIAFLPTGNILITEKSGSLRIVSPDGKISAPVSGLPAVDARSQGGLLGIALDPKFASNQLIYWSYAERNDDGTNNTAVARGKLIQGSSPKLENVQVIFEQTPSLKSTLHFGSRLVFGRDGTLFVTTGDRSITEGRMQAQRLDGQLGKVVRIHPDGSIPKDNPYAGKAIWSIGHRNIQGAALHPATGELWTIEHGTRGGDELNIARKGKDYGWPTIAYGIEYGGGTITGGIQAKQGMEQPIYYWDPVIAPGGMTFYTGGLFPAWKNSLFIGGMGSTRLVRLSLNGDKVIGEEHLLTELRERLRDVVQGPDGALYIVTDSGRFFKLVPRKSK
ncbi:MAG: PQQ-dependent sugar dehydrogenase [Acidobacteria bacterium]|nr:PQQ-dependent sugar dehydrogenase [Acidobacteriota bacterium]